MVSTALAIRGNKLLTAPEVTTVAVVVAVVMMAVAAHHTAVADAGLHLPVAKATGLVKLAATLMSTTPAQLSRPIVGLERPQALTMVS